MSASNCKSTYLSFCLKGSKQSCEKKQDELEDEVTDSTSENIETVNNDDKSKQNQLPKRKRKKVNKCD